MIVEAQVTIVGSKSSVWAAITNIEGAADLLGGVEKIEVVARPAVGLVGLRWLETRILFGKPATVEKWITDAAEYKSFQTRAESDGFVFLTTMRIADGPAGVVLTSVHESRPQSIVAKLMSIPMRLFFKGVARKAILQDLNDIKAAVERR